MKTAQLFLDCGPHPQFPMNLEKIPAAVRSESIHYGDKCTALP